MQYAYDARTQKTKYVFKTTALRPFDNDDKNAIFKTIHSN